MSLKLGKYGAFIGCSRYPECKFSRVLAPTGAESAEGDRPGVRVLGEDPATGEEITLRNGRFGDYVQQGEGEKPKRSSLPRGLSADDVTLEKALTLLAAAARGGAPSDERRADPRRHRPLWRLRAARQDLRQSRPRRRRARDRRATARSTSSSPRRAARGRALRRRAPARVLGEHPEGGTVSVKQGRFGPYVNHGKINATLPKGTDPASLTLDEAVELLKAKAAGGGVIGRLVGEHPDGGPVTVRDGRFGAYVNWGKVNATLPKGIAPDSVTLVPGSGADRRTRGQACGSAAQVGKAPREGQGQPAKAPAKTEGR